MASPLTDSTPPALPRHRIDGSMSRRGFPRALRRALRDSLSSEALVVLGPACASGAPSPVGDVLAWVDGSSRSEAVLPTALAAARAIGGRLRVIAVLPTTTHADPAAGDAERFLAGRLTKAVLALEAADGEVDWEVLHGDTVVEAIVADVRVRGAALLALNTHDATTSDAACVGGTALTTLRAAPVPVLLTRVRVTPPTARSARSSAPIRWAPPRAQRGAAEQRIRPMRSAVAEGTVPPSETRRRRRRRSIIAVTAGAVMVALVTVPTPMRVADTGLRPIREHPDAVEVTTGEGGQILYPFTRARRGSTLEALRAWIGRGSTAPLAVDADGGLAHALGAIDARTPGDLTGGSRVAAVGGIRPDGTVMPVADVTHITRAARQAQVDLLLVPCPNLEAALFEAALMRVTCVRSVAEALEAIAVIGGGLTPEP